MTDLRLSDLYSQFLSFINQLKMLKSMNPIPGPIGSSRIRRNPGCGTTNGSNSKIIITPHLITIHLISTMGCNFIQLSDPTIDFNDMGDWI